jgi:osmotically inducible protein OsmC
MQRTAQAQWRGDLKSGNGSLTTASRTLAHTPYSFVSRFEQGKGTNPEELLAAAHAGCFTMDVSARLTKAGFPPDTLDTTCTITLDHKDGGFSITESHLELNAKVAAVSQEAFQQVVEEAKKGCPVSKLFHTNVTLTAKLEPTQAQAGKP